MTSDAAQSGTPGCRHGRLGGQGRRRRGPLPDQHARCEQLRSEATTRRRGRATAPCRGLRSLSDELKQMASSSEQSGIATGPRRPGRRPGALGGRLARAAPAGEVLDEVRDFARRRPGTFLAAAAVVGLIGGRLTRGLTARLGQLDVAAPRSRRAAAPAAPAGVCRRAGASVGSDPTRVDAGIDPATYTHPRPASGPPEAWPGGVEGARGRRGRRGRRVRPGAAMSTQASLRLVPPRARSTT